MTDHKNIYEALLAAQSNFSKPLKNAENSHFKQKYADLDADLDAVKTHLHKEGIVYFQPIVSGEFGHAVKTILKHAATDTSIETDVPLIMQKQDMQAFKSASTYARRIGIENLTGLAPSEGDDDAETERTAGGNSMGAALKDAWKQGVLDSIPENATPLQKATAFADQICIDFASKTGEKALNNDWSRRKAMIEQMQSRFPELADKIVDAFEMAKNDITASKMTAA